MQKIAAFISYFLHRPGRVFLCCLAFAFTSLVLNGTFLNLYRLQRDHSLILEQIEATKLTVVDLDRQLKMAKDPAFIERQALNLYDFAEEDDLVFVFADE